jgi:hypothetical protein
MRAGGLELLDDGEEVADRAGQAIEPDHDRVSPGRISCSRRARTGRLRSAPDACSSSTVAQPAARRSLSCGSVPCSSVDTRAYPIRRPEAAVILTFACIMPIASRVAAKPSRARVR